MLGRLTEAAPLLRGRGVHLGALTAVLARRYDDRPAVEDEAASPGLHDGGARTHREIEDAVARLAAAHRTHGIGPGDTVLIVVDNRIDTVLHALAVARIGALPALANPRLKPHELDAVAGATGATLVVTDSATTAVDDLPSVTTEQDLTATLEADPRARVDPPDELDPAAPALLLTTSGTTGAPKAAALSSRGLLASIGRLAAAPVGYRIGPRSDRDRLLAALPLTHVMGFSVVLGAMCAGVPLLHRHRFDAAEVLDLIEERGPNAFAGVPTMYADLEAAGAAHRNLSSIQLWISAADAMPTERARRFQTYGAAFRVGPRARGAAAFADVYGMVELSGAAAVRLFPPSPLARVEVPAVAVVLPGVEVRAVDEQGHPVRPGRVGELQFRGAGVLSHYAGDEAQGAGPQGWFATGDHGRLWPGGLFAFSGRRKDRLKVGGFSVFPAEVEEELRNHPDVAEVAVVGVPDERLGERLLALVVPTVDGAEPFDPDAFVAWAREQVAGYRRPTEAIVVEGLPRGTHGKIDRATATAWAAQLLEERT